MKNNMPLETVIVTVDEFLPLLTKWMGRLSSKLQEVRQTPASNSEKYVALEASISEVERCHDDLAKLLQEKVREKFVINDLQVPERQLVNN